MYSLELQWKEFNVNLDKVNFIFKTNLSSDFDGLIADSDSLKVIFKNEITQDDIDYINTYWDNITAASFNKTTEEIIQGKIDDAITFGGQIILEAVITNVTLGITQVGKTRIVSDYLRALQRYLREGSLYAAVEEIDELILNGIPGELAPFVTIEKLQAVKTKIQEYLVI